MEARDNLFRGKNEEGEWIEGFYVFQEKDQCEYNRKHLIFRNNPLGVYRTEVIPETVGKYTDLNDGEDFDGEKMFSGDIIEVDWNGKREKALIWFTGGSFVYELSCGSLFHLDDADNPKIIGNKTDNPELLENKK